MNRLPKYEKVKQSHLNLYTMRKFLFLLTIVIVLSCKKSNGKGDYCYSCRITGGFPYQDRMLDTCVENEGQGLEFEDANGNDLNSFCTRR